MLGLSKPMPDAWLMNGMLWWGKQLSKETVFSKGFYLELPDLSGASTEFRNQLENQTQILLALCGDEFALQVHWSVDSDYRDELERYHALTLEGPNVEWTRFIRNLRYETELEKMKMGVLRRERLAFFLSRKASTIPKRGLGTLKQIDSFLKQMAKNFEDRLELVRMVFPEANVVGMGDKDHYAFIKRFFNPSFWQMPHSGESRYEGFDPDASLMDNCMPGDGISVQGDGWVGFKMDGYYHALLVMRRWPQSVEPGILNSLTTAFGREYSITQNLYPIPIKREIEKEEKLIRRLEGELQRNRSHRAAINKKETKINSLMLGVTIPFNVMTVIRAWDKSEDGLIAKVSALKTAIQGMRMAQCHQVNHPAQAYNVFFETIPGNLAGKNRAWDLYAEHVWLADLLPMSSTFIGDLNEGQILFEGMMGNLTGVRMFSGITPQNAFITGMAGAGKSVLMAEILSQSDALNPIFTAIIEEGLSYGIYTRLNGEKPIILHPDSSDTINYFDTLGLPLSKETMAIGTALCLKMVGINNSEDVNNYRSAIIGEYISKLYDDAAKDWEDLHDVEMEFIRREAFVVEQIRSKMTPGSTFIDAYVSLREIKENDPSHYEELLKTPSEDQIVSFSKNSNTASRVRDLIFAYWKPEDYETLTHTSLVNVMQFCKLSHHKVEDVNFLASMMSSWTRHGGRHGVLFDGITNVNLKGMKVAHFELGSIPNADRELKEAAVFLLSNFVRQHIVTLPRGSIKRVIFEEAGRFLAIPNGDKVIAEFYEQLRKYQCWVCTIIQQYARFRGTPLANVIIGNSKLFLLLRQQDREDVADLSEKIGLPDLAQDAILNHPLPEHQKGAISSYFTLFAIDGTRVKCGTCRVTISEAMKYVASSNGELFDKRNKALANYKDIFDGVLAESGFEAGLIKTPNNRVEEFSLAKNNPVM